MHSKFYYWLPRHQLSSHDRRAFCAAGPSVWNSNSLPDSWRDPIIGGNVFRNCLNNNF